MHITIHRINSLINYRKPQIALIAKEYGNEINNLS